jgi:choline-glycine betaine transporter
VPDNPDVTIDPKVVAETVQFFITAMDSLKLNMNAIDQVLFTPPLRVRVRWCVCVCVC